MKIEKINDNQIKCTLNKSDLAARQINLSELAYGTDKAKALFTEMMNKAATEFGFIVEDIPIMIEAIPVSSDSIILLVTKVEEPEELDTRFSQFSPFSDDEDDANDVIDRFGLNEENVLDLFRDLKDELEDSGFVPLAKTVPELVSKDNDKNEYTEKDIVQLFAFESIDIISDLGRMTVSTYNGRNTLYKLDNDKYYYLALHSSGMNLEEFNSLCNLLSEYGTYIRNHYNDEGYYAEHGRVICADNALQKLACL